MALQQRDHTYSRVGLSFTRCRDAVVPLLRLAHSPCQRVRVGSLYLLGLCLLRFPALAAHVGVLRVLIFSPSRWLAPSPLLRPLAALLASTATRLHAGLVRALVLYMTVCSCQCTQPSVRLQGLGDTRGVLLGRGDYGPFKPGNPHHQPPPKV